MSGKIGVILLQRRCQPNPFIEMAGIPKSRWVFINCPFDSNYRELFEAIVFAVARCGFEPRSALESATSGRGRFGRLMKLIGECNLSIHDLSRVELDAHTKLPRFNMPWELGVCMGARELGRKDQSEKDFLILERLCGDCLDSCSDLGGVYPQAHGNNPIKAVQHVRTWLTEHSRTPLAGPKAINTDYQSFRHDLPDMLDSLEIQPHEMTFVDFRRAVRTWLKAGA